MTDEKKAAAKKPAAKKTKTIQESNLELWNLVSKTNPKHTKEVRVGARKFTAVDAYHQIERATQLWGPMGIGWGVEESDYGVTVYEGIELAIYTGTLWYLHGDDQERAEVPIAASIRTHMGQGDKKRTDEDFVKKVRTDALTKGFSMLGFSADIFQGKWDDNKYVQEMEQNFAAKGSPAQEVVPADVPAAELCSKAIANGIRKAIGGMDQENKLVKKLHSQLEMMITDDGLYPVAQATKVIAWIKSQKK